MANIIQDFFKNLDYHETLPLEDVRLGLEEALQDQMELIPLMERHHDYIQQSISVLLEKDSTEVDKQDHLFRFFRLVEMHGRAEEEVLYTALQHNDDREARLDGFAAQDEHDIVFRIERELYEMGYRDNWNEEIEAKAKVVATLVRNHIKEEEQEVFPLAEKVLTVSHLELMCFSYIDKCRVYLANSANTSVSNPVIRPQPIGSDYPH